MACVAGFGAAVVAVGLLLARPGAHITFGHLEARDARAAVEPKQFWAVEGAGHVDLEVYAPEEYRRCVVGFLADRLRSTPSR